MNSVHVNTFVNTGTDSLQSIVNRLQDLVPKLEATLEKGNKKAKGQFYTVNSTYILEGLALPPSTVRTIIEPFAGKGDLIDWLRQRGITQPVEAYDIEPKRAGIQKRDTLTNPPNYDNAWIITNPPYLARNRSASKTLFDTYSTNDLYKCFITTLTTPPLAAGGIMIIPSGFFLSPRDLDVRCRHAFMTQYRVLKVKYFEETVFPDTTTTVVAVSFEKSPIALTEQAVDWVNRPSGLTQTFTMKAADNWIIGGDIYKLPTDVHIRRYVLEQKLKTDEYISSMTLNAVDSGTQVGRISLDYKEGYIYPAQECSRTYATLCIRGRVLTAEEQKRICSEFSTFVEQKRKDTWSLFLPQFRESKEYARKRMPFELAYTIVGHLISKLR